MVLPVKNSISGNITIQSLFGVGGSGGGIGDGGSLVVVEAIAVREIGSPELVGVIIIRELDGETGGEGVGNTDETSVSSGTILNEGDCIVFIVRNGVLTRIRDSLGKIVFEGRIEGDTSSMNTFIRNTVIMIHSLNTYSNQFLQIHGVQFQETLVM